MSRGPPHLRTLRARRFRTDGKTIFSDIVRGVSEGELIDLKQRQRVFKTLAEPSLESLEFDAETVARWYPLGPARRTIVVDPARAFGRPISGEGGVPTRVLADAVAVEGSPERVARLYEVAVAVVRDALAFERKLVA